MIIGSSIFPHKICKQASMDIYTYVAREILRNERNILEKVVVIVYLVTNTKP
jgi:hypothetical protein